MLFLLAECPETPLDNRTLFDRLREQKMKDEEEKEEAKKMSNQEIALLFFMELQ